MGLFDTYEPEPQESGPKIKLTDIGDRFEGVVTRVSDVFDGDYGEYYWINVSVQQGKGEDVPVGEEAGYPVSLWKQQSVADVKAGKSPKVGHVHEELQKALKRAGKSTLDEGDYIGVLFVEAVQGSNKTFKPFRKHAVIVQPAEPKSVFEGTKAPF